MHPLGRSRLQKAFPSYLWPVETILRVFVTRSSNLPTLFFSTFYCPLSALTRLLTLHTWKQLSCSGTVYTANPPHLSGYLMPTTPFLPDTPPNSSMRLVPIKPFSFLRSLCLISHSPPPPPSPFGSCFSITIARGIQFKSCLELQHNHTLDMRPLFSLQTSAYLFELVLFL